MVYLSTDSVQKVRFYLLRDRFEFSSAVHRGKTEWNASEWQERTPIGRKCFRLPLCQRPSAVETSNKKYAMHLYLLSCADCSALFLAPRLLRIRTVFYSEILFSLIQQTNSLIRFPPAIIIIIIIISTVRSPTEIVKKKRNQMKFMSEVNVHFK